MDAILSSRSFFSGARPRASSPGLLPLDRARRAAPVPVVPVPGYHVATYHRAERPARCGTNFLCRLVRLPGSTRCGTYRSWTDRESGLVVFPKKARGLIRLHPVVTGSALFFFHPLHMGLENSAVFRFPTRGRSTASYYCRYTYGKHLMDYRPGFPPRVRYRVLSRSSPASSHTDPGRDTWHEE